MRLKMSSFFGLFFFFQAEDGIRDRDVTGVQTCALPISLALLPIICEAADRNSSCAGQRVTAGLIRELSRHSDLKIKSSDTVPSSSGPQPVRSEERRVGKECRSRW